MEFYEYIKNMSTFHITESDEFMLHSASDNLNSLLAKSYYKCIRALW